MRSKVCIFSTVFAHVASETYIFSVFPSFLPRKVEQWPCCWRSECIYLAFSLHGRAGFLGFGHRAKHAHFFGKNGLFGQLLVNRGGDPFMRSKVRVFTLFLLMWLPIYNLFVCSSSQGSICTYFYVYLSSWGSICMYFCIYFSSRGSICTYFYVYFSSRGSICTYFYVCFSSVCTATSDDMILLGHILDRFWA